MFKPFIVLSLSALVLSACSMFQRPERLEQDPVHISGTNYQTYLLILSTDRDYEDRIEQDPNATRAYYAIVGPGLRVYCGRSWSGCERAIRRFNNGRQSGEDEM